MHLSASNDTAFHAAAGMKRHSIQALCQLHRGVQNRCGEFSDWLVQAGLVAAEARPDTPQAALMAVMDAKNEKVYVA
jgi:hypothetical protein